MQLWIDTLRALVRPQRLIPIVAVAVPLVVAQHHYSHDRVLADGISVLLILGFLLIGPWSWRRFAVPGGVGALLWPVTGLLPFALGTAMSELVEASPSYLLSSVNGVLSGALYHVGSWGLGRDLELEAGLDRMTARAQALGQAAAVLVPEEFVFRVGFQVGNFAVGIDTARLLIGPRQHDLADQLLHRPAFRHETRGQMI